MLTVCVPGDAPPVLAASRVWSELKARAKVLYYDTLPDSEARLIERIGPAEVVLNIRSSVKFTARVLAACPALCMISVWGTGNRF